MRRWVIRLVAVAVFAALVAAAGPGFEEQRFSCHECRNLKYVATHHFLFVQGTPMEREEDRFPIPGGHHTHDWWQYSTFKSQGIAGWLGKSVGCKPSMYKDGMCRQEDAQQDHPR